MELIIFDNGEEYTVFIPSENISENISLWKIAELGMLLQWSVLNDNLV